MLVCSSGRDKLDIEVLELIASGEEQLADCFVHLSIQGFTGSVEARFPAVGVRQFCDSVLELANGVSQSADLHAEEPCTCSMHVESLSDETVVLSISLSRSRPDKSTAPDSCLSGTFIITPDRLAIAAERFGNLSQRVQA